MSIYIESLSSSWREVEILYQEALANFDKNPAVYNALCRSITVLIVANLEGFLKEVSKALVNDIATVPFSLLPQNIKRQHCTIFLGPILKTKEYNLRVKKLIEEFEKYPEYKISNLAFLHGNNNPKSSIIEIYADCFGCSNIFKELRGSVIDNRVFSGATNKTLRRVYCALGWLLKRKLKNFPYNIDENFLKLEKIDCKEKGLWELFIEKINMHRHGIVHGNEFANNTNHNELEEDILKTKIFQLAFIAVVCLNLSIKMPEIKFADQE